MPRKTYSNIMNKKKMHGSVASGAADPFLIKVNGYYYITYTVPKGLTLSKSSDLLHWEPVNATGIVGEDEHLFHAYAPEITYWDGKFILTCSPSGNGHYLYQADHIEGPYTLLQDNFQEMIDGSFFEDTDEKRYFLRASETGITMKQWKETAEEKGYFPLFSHSFNFEEAVIGGWTEGPYLLKRYGFYYLTFTGTHFLSTAYRVSYCSGTSIQNPKDMQYQDILLLKTSEDFYGLGHSMSFIGPDLDSTYIAYHNMMKNGVRYLNISRLLFNGKGQMMVNGVEKADNPIFRRPTFETFIDTCDYLTTFETKAEGYSVEYNFMGEETKLYIGYQGQQDYQALVVRAQVLYLMDVTDGEQSFSEIYRFQRRYRDDVYHTLRLQYRHQKLAIYFDQKELVYHYACSLRKGKIGFEKNQLRPAYFAYSDVAFGSSDQQEIKRDHCYFETMVEKKGKRTTDFFIDTAGYYDVQIEEWKKFKNQSFSIDHHTLTALSPFVLCQRQWFKRGIHTLSLPNTMGTFDRITWIKSVDWFGDFDQKQFLAEAIEFGKHQTLEQGIYFENDRHAILSPQAIEHYDVSMQMKIFGNPIHENNVAGLCCEVEQYGGSNGFENLTSLFGYLLVCNRKNIYILQAKYDRSEVIGVYPMVASEEEIALRIRKESNALQFFVQESCIATVYLAKPSRGQVGIYMNHASVLCKDFYLQSFRKELKEDDK